MTNPTSTVTHPWQAPAPRNAVLSVAAGIVARTEAETAVAVAVPAAGAAEVEAVEVPAAEAVADSAAADTVAAATKAKTRKHATDEGRAGRPSFFVPEPRGDSRPRLSRRAQLGSASHEPGAYPHPMDKREIESPRLTANFLIRITAFVLLLFGLIAHFVWRIF